jgi:hypothetical protein
MTETGIRVVVIVVILGVILAAAAINGRSRRARPVGTARDDLPPGVHLFTSATCASVYGDAFTETRHEVDPQSFGHHAIVRVPTLIVVLADSSALVFEGLPRRRHLPVIPPESIASR